MENIDTQDLADRIANMIGSKANDFAEIRATLQDLSQRIEKIETAVEAPRPVLPNHPSQERFELIEAIADRFFSGQSEEKACAFEPNGKPCDHCSMCSSRGF